MMADYIKITPDTAPALIGRNVWLNDVYNIDGIYGVITGWEKTPYYSRVVVETTGGDIRKYIVAFENTPEKLGMHLLNEVRDVA